MLLQQLINGITLGCTYALVALGYSMVFSVLELINFANGAFYMLGGYMTLMLYLGIKRYFWWAVILSSIIVGLIGYAMDRFCLRTLRQRGASKMSALISTLGVSIFIENFIQLAFGTEMKAFPNMLNFGRFKVAGVMISWTQVMILVISIMMLLLLCLIVYKTKIGSSMRAITQNVTAARLMGIDVKNIISLTFIISAAMASIAGTLVSIYYQTIDINMGTQVGMKTFAAAVLGGMGVLPGAMVGGVLIGIIETLGASYISSGYRDAFAFIVLILVLLFKPDGLFGEKQITKV